MVEEDEVEGMRGKKVETEAERGSGEAAGQRDSSGAAVRQRRVAGGAEPTGSLRETAPFCWLAAGAYAASWGDALRGLIPFCSLPKCCVLAACGRFGRWGYVGDVELMEFRLRVLCVACDALGGMWNFAVLLHAMGTIASTGGESAAVLVSWRLGVLSNRSVMRLHWRGVGGSLGGGF